MKVVERSGEKILQPCSLEWFDYQIDPYIGCEHHCYYCYTLNQNDTEKTGEVFIYKEIAGQLIDELSQLEPQTVYLGMNTDPYQPCEKIYQQTRKALELLAHRGFSACILTKSDLVSRDVELLKRMSGSSVGFSIAFQDEAVRQIFEPKAPPNQKRIDALKKLKKAGIETYTLITPVMPFITNVNKLIERVESFADTIWIYGLSMESKKDKNWENIKDILNQRFPDLVEKYQEIAFSGGHSYWIELRQKLEKLQRRRKLNLEIKV